MKTTDYTELTELAKKLLEEKLQRKVETNTSSIWKGEVLEFKFRNHFIYDDIKLSEYTNIVKVPVFYDEQAKKLKIEFKNTKVVTISEDFYFNIDYYLERLPEERVPQLLKVRLTGEGFFPVKGANMCLYTDIKPYPHGSNIFSTKIFYDAKISDKELEANVVKTEILYIRNNLSCIIMPYRTRRYKTIDKAVKDISNIVVEMVDSLTYSDNDDEYGQFVPVVSNFPEDWFIFNDYVTYKNRHFLLNNPHIDKIKDKKRIKLI